MNEEYQEEELDMTFLEREAEKALQDLALLERDLDSVDLKQETISSVSAAPDFSPGNSQDHSVRLDDVEQEGLESLVGLSRQLDAIAPRLSPAELQDIQSAFGNLTRFVLKKNQEPPVSSSSFTHPSATLNSLNYPIEPVMDTERLNKRHVEETSKIYEDHIKKLEDHILSLEKQNQFNKKIFLQNEKNLNEKIKKLIQINKKLTKLNTDDASTLAVLNSRILELQENLNYEKNLTISLHEDIKRLNEDRLRGENYLIKKYEQQLRLVKKSLFIMKKVNEELLGGQGVSGTTSASASSLLASTGLGSRSSSPQKKLRSTSSSSSATDSGRFIGIAGVSLPPEEQLQFSPNSSPLAALYFQHKQQSSALFMRLTDRLLSLKHNPKSSSGSAGNSSGLLQKSLSFTDLSAQNALLDGMVKILQEELTVSSTFLEAMIPIIQDRPTTGSSALSEETERKISADLLSSKHYEEILRPLVEVSLKAQADCVKAIETAPVPLAPTSAPSPPSLDDSFGSQHSQRSQRSQMSDSDLDPTWRSQGEIEGDMRTSLNQSVQSFSSLQEKKILYRERTLAHGRAQSTPPRASRGSLLSQSASFSSSSSSAIRSLRSRSRGKTPGPPLHGGSLAIRRRIVYSEKDSVLQPSSITSYESGLLSKRQENFFDEQISLWEKNKIFLNKDDAKLSQFLTYLRGVLAEIDVKLEPTAASSSPPASKPALVEAEEAQVSHLVSEATSLLSDISCLIGADGTGGTGLFPLVSPSSLTTLSSPRFSTEPNLAISSSSPSPPSSASTPNVPGFGAVSPEVSESETNFTLSLFLRSLSRLRDKLMQQDASNNFFSLDQVPGSAPLTSQEQLFHKSFSVSPRFINPASLNNKEARSWQEFITPETKKFFRETEDTSASEAVSPYVLPEGKVLNELLEQLQPREVVSFEEISSSFREAISAARNKPQGGGLNDSTSTTLLEIAECNKSLVDSYNKLIQERNFFLSSLNLLSRQHGLIKENYKSEIFLTVKTIWDLKTELNSLEIENKKLHEKLTKFYHLNDRLVSFYQNQRLKDKEREEKESMPSFEILSVFNQSLLERLSAAQGVPQGLSVLSSAFHGLYQSFTTFQDELREAHAQIRAQNRNQGQTEEDPLNASLHDLSFSQHNLSLSTNPGQGQTPHSQSQAKESLGRYDLGEESDDSGEDYFQGSTRPFADQKEESKLENIPVLSSEQFSSFLCLMLQVLDVCQRQAEQEEKAATGEQVRLLELRLTSANNNLQRLQQDYDRLKIKTLDDDIDLLHLRTKINETFHECEASFSLPQADAKNNSSSTGASSSSGAVTTLPEDKLASVNSTEKMDQLRQYISSMKGEYERLKETISQQREVIEKADRVKATPQQVPPTYLSDLKYISETQSEDGTSPFSPSFQQGHGISAHLQGGGSPDHDVSTLFRLDFNDKAPMEQKALIQRLQYNLYYFYNKCASLEKLFQNSQSSSSILSQANNRFLVSKHAARIQELTSYYTSLVSRLNATVVELKNFLQLEKAESESLKKHIAELRLTIHQLTHHLKLLQAKQQPERDSARDRHRESEPHGLNRSLNMSLSRRDLLAGGAPFPSPLVGSGPGDAKRERMNSTTSLGLDQSASQYFSQHLPMNLSQTSLNLSQTQPLSTSSSQVISSNKKLSLHLSPPMEDLQDEFFLSEELAQSLRETLGSNFHEEVLRNRPPTASNQSPGPAHQSLVFPSHPEDLSSIQHSSNASTSQLLENRSLYF